jgi:hypothetical protein
MTAVGGQLVEFIYSSLNGSGNLLRFLTVARVVCRTFRITRVGARSLVRVPK